MCLKDKIYIVLIYAQFRIGILPLYIQTGRYKTVTDQETGRIRKMYVDKRLICESNIFEDEKHFVFHFKMYTEERNKSYDTWGHYINKAISKPWINDDKLKYIMKHEL